MYEALIREGMDAEGMDKFDAALDEASDVDQARRYAKRMETIRALGGEVD